MTQTRSDFEKLFEDLDERHHDAIAIKDAHIKAITESMNEEVDRLRTRHREEIQKKDSELTDVRNTLNAEIMELRDELNGLVANKEAEILNIESQHRSQIVTRDAQIDGLSKANTGLSTGIDELKRPKFAEPKFDFQTDKDSAFVEVANAGEEHAAFSAVVRVQDPSGQFSSPSSLSWSGQDDPIAILLTSDKARLRLATSKMEKSGFMGRKETRWIEIPGMNGASVQFDSWTYKEGTGHRATRLEVTVTASPLPGFASSQGSKTFLLDVHNDTSSGDIVIAPQIS